MFILLSASLIFCGVIAATSDFPDLLMENGVKSKELEESGVRFIANPLRVGDKPCQMDVKLVKQLNGYCSLIGFGINACVADTHVQPFHPRCNMYR